MSRPAARVEKKPSSKHGKKPITDGVEQQQMQKESILNKTKMCTFFKRGKCTKGINCTFAHCEEDLAAAPDLGKTKLCKTVLEGGICNNPGCRYAHSADELRRICRPLSFPSEENLGQLPHDQSVSLQVQPPLRPGLVVPRADRECVRPPTLEAASTRTFEATPQVAVYSQLQPPRAASITNQNAANLGSQIQAVPVKGTVSEAMESLQQIVQMVSGLSSSVNHKEKERLQAELTHVISMLHCNQQLDGTSVRSGSTQSAFSTSDGDYAAGDYTLDVDVETSGQSNFSRQSTAAEFESVPAWSRQVSLWGYNPAHGTGTPDSGTTDTDRLSAIQSHSDLREELSSEHSNDSLEADDSIDAPCDNHDTLREENHNLPGMSFSMDSLPDLPWTRQESSKSTISTGSAMFEEMSSAYGLHWQVKNSFIDVDPVAQLVKPRRKTRSVTPPPRQDVYDSVDDLDLGCFTRQLTK